MTQFSEGRFQKDGMYLIWYGNYDGMPIWGENAHPSKAGTPRDDLFIARFKYSGPFTAAKFKKQLMKRFTVEEYVELYKEGHSPLDILAKDDPEWYVETLNKHYKREVAYLDNNRKVVVRR